MKDVSQMDEEDLFERLTRTHERPRGIVCLDQLQDTRNLGAIVRAGVAFGLEDYVLTRHGQARVGEAAWKLPQACWPMPAYFCNQSREGVEAP